MCVCVCVCMCVCVCVNELINDTETLPLMANIICNCLQFSCRKETHHKFINEGSSISLSTLDNYTKD